MQDEHLNREDSSLLSSGKLANQQLAKALLHLEECKTCQAKTNAPNAAQILDALFAEATDARFENDLTTIQSETSRLWQPNLTSNNRRLIFGFGAACAMILTATVAAVWWSSAPFANSNTTLATTPATAVSPATNRKNQDVANVLPEANETNASQANLPPINSGTEIEASENARNVWAQKQSKTIAANQKPKSYAPKQAANSRNFKEFAPNAAAARPEADFDRLNRFLTVLPPVLINLRASKLNLRSIDAKDEQASGSVEQTKNTIRLLTPRGEVIRETQPTFKWQAIAAAKQYKISVFDQNYKEIIVASTESDSYQLKTRLKPGETYFWQVAAQTAQSEPIDARTLIASAKFRAASRHTIARLRQAKTQKSAWRLIAILLEEGLLGEAKTELQKILKRSPQNDLARRLLNRVQTLRGDAPLKN